MAIDFNNIESIIEGFIKILNLSGVGGPPSVPTPLLLIGVPRKPGLSSIKIASNIIERKAEAGLPVGALPSGAVNPDELMERIRIEEIIKAIVADLKITVAIPPGIPVQASGIGPSGPVTVVGTTIRSSKGYGIAQ
jgi:hypothetical protein